MRAQGERYEYDAEENVQNPEKALYERTIPPDVSTGIAQAGAAADAAAQDAQNAAAAAATAQGAAGAAQATADAAATLASQRLISIKSYDFGQGSDAGWFLSACTSADSIFSTSRRLLASGSGPYISLSGLTLNPATVHVVAVRVKVNVCTTWEGKIFWSKGGHGFTDPYSAALPEPAHGEWALLVFDLREIADYMTGSVTGFRLDFGASADTDIDVDFITLGKFGEVVDYTKEISDISSDNVLSQVEKTQVIREYGTITNERAGILGEATRYGATSTTYDNAVTALVNYMATLTTPVAWNDMSGVTTIVGTTFRQKFSDVYSARQALLNKITENAKLAGQVTRDQTTLNNLDNLWPNPTSESAPPPGADTNASEWVDRYNAGAGAFAGSWTRRLYNGYAYNLHRTVLIPCAPDEVFYFEAYAKRESGAGDSGIYMEFLDASSNVLATGSNGYASVSSRICTAASWTRIATQGTAPSGAVNARISYYVAPGVTAQFDAFYARRAIDSRATAGQLADAVTRAINAIGKDSTYGQLYWKGNNDSSVNSGVPVIIGAGGANPRIRIWYNVINNGDHFAEMLIRLQPVADTDNLDGISYVEVEWFNQSAAGTTATLTSLGTSQYIMTGRRYITPGTPSDATNSQQISAPVLRSSTLTAFVAAKISVSNQRGYTGQLCFYQPSVGSELVCSGTSWPAGLTGATGGSSGGGSEPTDPYCPDVREPILMYGPNGVYEKLAGEVQVGDLVWTVPEDGGEMGAYPVSAVAVLEGSEEMLVDLDDRTSFRASPPHRVRTTDGRWVEIRNLVPGDELDGLVPRKVAMTMPMAPGSVVRITVDVAHTYICSGVLSHNAKKQL